MLKNDKWIAEKSLSSNLISPFQEGLIREVDGLKVISFGQSSYGYDIRLSSKEFLIFKHIPGTVVNPKNFNPNNLESTPLCKDEYGEFFIIPAHSYALGVALEKLKIPSNITAICLGKSTYARVGLIVNVTPAESSWEGFLTIEFSNSASADCRVYVNEGVAQLLFLEGEECAVTYAARNGKYQHQLEEVTLARV